MKTGDAVDIIKKPLRAPLFVQVLGLALLSLVAAQLVNVGIVFLLPPPPPEYFTINFYWFYTGITVYLINLTAIAKCAE